MCKQSDGDCLPIYTERGRERGRERGGREREREKGRGRDLEAGDSERANVRRDLCVCVCVCVCQPRVRDDRGRTYFCGIKGVRLEADERGRGRENEKKRGM